MKMIDAIAAAADFLGLPSDTATLKADSRLPLLVRCANRAYRETALGVMPLKKTEAVEFADGRAALAALSKRLYKIEGLKKHGVAVAYKIDGDGLFADTDRAELTYSYVPEYKGADDEIENAALTEDTLGYGICAEYALINGLYEKSVTFRERFAEGLRNACVESKERRVKRRRWY